MRREISSLLHYLMNQCPYCVFVFVYVNLISFVPKFVPLMNFMNIPTILVCSMFPDLRQIFEYLL